MAPRWRRKVLGGRPAHDPPVVRNDLVIAAQALPGACGQRQPAKIPRTERQMAVAHKTFATLQSLVHDSAPERLQDVPLQLEELLAKVVREAVEALPQVSLVFAMTPRHIAWHTRAFASRPKRRQRAHLERLVFLPFEGHSGRAEVLQARIDVDAEIFRQVKRTEHVLPDAIHDSVDVAVALDARPPETAISKLVREPREALIELRCGGQVRGIADAVGAVWVVEEPWSSAGGVIQDDVHR